MTSDLLPPTSGEIESRARADLPFWTNALGMECGRRAGARLLISRPSAAGAVRAHWREAIRCLSVKWTRSRLRLFQTFPESLCPPRPRIADDRIPLLSHRRQQLVGDEGVAHGSGDRIGLVRRSGELRGAGVSGQRDC